MTQHRRGAARVPASWPGRPAALAVFFGALGAMLSLPAAGADPAAGRRKAATCVACHGEFGISVQPDAPGLAGQPAPYVAAQLRLYRSGKRAHEVMAVIAKPLSDADIDDLAAWFAAIEIEARPPK